MTTIVAKESTFEVLPTGEYLAQIVDIEDVDGNYGPQFQFQFEIVKPKPFEGKTMRGWCSQSPSLKSKLMSWTAAAFNRPIETGEAVDTMDLIGRKVVLVIITEPKSDGSGEEINKISNVKPYKSQEPMPKAGRKVDSDEFEVGNPATKPSEDPFENE